MRKPNIRRILSLLLCTLLILGALPAALAAEDDRATVRVAYFESAHFLEGAADGAAKRGYAYEILHEITNRTGWHCEYVYGDWATLFAAFEAGEIDLFFGLAKREDRAERMDWSERTIDTEFHSLFVHEDDERFAADDPQSLNGKRIGLIRNNNMSDEFFAWAAEHGIETEYAWFDDVDAMTLALDDRTIDGFVGSENNVDHTHPSRIFARVAETRSHIAVRKNAPELKRALDDAMEAIEREEPDFYIALKRKYYNTGIANATLSPAEEAWLSEHGTLRIGYAENYLPFSGTDAAGKPDGILPDIVNDWLGAMQLGGRLSVRFLPYTTYNAMIDALGQGEIDAAFPVMNSVWHADECGMTETETVVRSSISAVYTGDFGPDKLKTIAVSRNARLQEDFAREYFPGSELMYFDTMKECLNAVKYGYAGCSLYNGTRTLQALRGEFAQLSEVSLNIPTDFSFGVRKGDTALFTLLKRGLGLTGVEQYSTRMYRYIDNGGGYTAAAFLRDNALTILTLVIAVAAAFCLVILVFLGKARTAETATARLNLQLQKNRDELARALDAAERASKAKTTFLNSMSHDIRTPMNAIIGYTAIAMKQEPKPAVRESLTKIGQSSELLLTLINDVLDISRIESGTAKLSPAPADLTKTEDEVLAVIRGFLTGRELTVETERAPLAHPYVLLDAVRLREVLINILGNAVKSPPTAGRSPSRRRTAPARTKGTSS
ncbi:MAG: transporter substrate-binding domain-containing protein [Clostridia bacterium]|nr:transporter substrate-binding domain-containing protein [Clostridia bacterium]